MRLEFREISWLDPAIQTEWSIRTLAVDGNDIVIKAMNDWRKANPNDFKAILKVMRSAAQTKRMTNPKQVKKSANPKHGSVYEMIAFTGVARLMFFYDEEAASLIICTNTFQKGRGDQNAAFERCAEFKELYLAEKRRGGIKI